MEVRRTALQNLRDQIVVVRFGDLAAIKMARLRLAFFRKIIHENFAVDFRRVHRGAAFQQQIGFFR